MRYQYVQAALFLALSSVLVLSAETLAQDPEGTCCQYNSSGLLISCPTTTQFTCDVGPGVAFVWVCPPDGDGGCNPNTCALPAGVSPGDCSPTIILPVELTRFDAVSNGGGEVLLSWETATETNNSGFEIEMKARGGSFEQVGFVEGGGTTVYAQTYSYRVTDLDPGTYRFRLKQVDYDGAFDYSPTVEALVEVPGEYVLEEAYPNPFNPSTTVRFAVAAEQTLRLNLYDAGGRLVRTLYEGIAPAQSMQSVSIDGSDLASGTYHVRLEGPDILASQTITLSK